MSTPHRALNSATCIGTGMVKLDRISVAGTGREFQLRFSGMQGHRDDVLVSLSYDDMQALAAVVRAVVG